MTRPRVVPHSFGEVIYLPQAQCLWLPIRKNAHTAIFEAIWSNRAQWMQVPPRDLSKYHEIKRVAMWRDPFRRLESAYSYFKTRSQLEDLPSLLLNFPDWVMEVCNQADAQRNPHVASQTRIAKLFFDTLPEKIIRWNFPAMASELSLSEIVPRNASVRVKLDWSYHAICQVEKEYEKDLRIWRG